MKIKRLIEITTILLNKEKVTARELSQRLGVSPRTIYRDIEDLSQAGVPVYMTKGTGGGISVLENFSLNKALFSDADKETILLALKTLQVTKLPEIDAAIDKISSLFPQSQGDWVQIDFSNRGSSPNENNKFSDIKQAIVKRQLIKFQYVNSQGVNSERVVEPSKLVYKGKAWYLLAYCQRNRDFRLFRISRIKDLELSLEKFSRKPVPKDLDQNVDITWSENLTNLKLRFQPRSIHRIYDDFGHREITKNKDGSCDLLVSFPEDEWVYGYILSYGKDVEVIEPIHIRELILNRLEEMIKIYKK